MPHKDREAARQYRRRYRALNRERMQRRERLYYAANREKWLIANRKSRYGITRDDFAALVEGQQGLCGICRQFFGVKLCVDHNHATGKVRGLLCTNCNHGLGKFRDDPERLAAAQEYLKQAA